MGGRRSGRVDDAGGDVGGQLQQQFDVIKALDGSVHGTPAPIGIGTGGTTVSGPSPDGCKGVTVLLFTDGKAFAELEFDGPPDALVPADFVSDVGQKQDRAIKNGLGG